MDKVVRREIAHTSAAASSKSKWTYTQISVHRTADDEEPI